jgi:hypothetical protein
MNEEERKERRGYADESQKPGQPHLIWDDSQATGYSPATAQVKATKEEVWLLLGTTRKEHSEPRDLQSQSGVRIIMSPYTAKQLSIALNEVLRKCEETFGPLEEKPQTRSLQRQTQSPFRLPPFKSEEARERVSFLFDLLKNLDLTVGLERSFKVSEKTLLPNRFLLGFIPDSIRENPYEKILDVCKRMRMPEKFFPAFAQDLPEATMVGFGIEEDETACVVKAYVEFKKRYEEALKKGPNKSDSYVSHWGYKWDAAENTKGALARYTCFPAFTAEDILERLSASFYHRRERTPFELIKGVLDLASKKVGRDKFLFLEVNEENNPRSSYDINMYGANFRLEELYPFFSEMCQHYSIPDKQFHFLYDPVRTRTFAHISGGIDRKGRDFLTIYFGE